MRKALVVGIDHYEHTQGLHGCVNDAHSMKSVLERNSDGTVNFDVKLISATGSSDPISKQELRQHIKDLFSSEKSETALFYFAGHGHIEATGGYLVASDAETGDNLPLSEIITFSNRCGATNRIIVLDSCHSGIAANKPEDPDIAQLREGITILTASTEAQYATEKNGAGVFTTLFVDALNGAAGNLVGDVTPGSVYAHIDQSLGPWQQRPVFKTNVKSFVSLRKVQSPISLHELQRIAEFFPDPGYELKLDPTFEPERDNQVTGVPDPDPVNTATFAILQKYNRVNLLVPVDAPHMWHAAMQSKSCKLTVLGEHYRRLVKENRI